MYKTEEFINWAKDLQKLEIVLNNTVEQDWTIISEYKKSSFGSDNLCEENKYFSMLTDKSQASLDIKQFRLHMLWKTDFLGSYEDYCTNNVAQKDIYSLVLKSGEHNVFDSCFPWFGLHPKYAQMLNLTLKSHTFPPIWLDRKGQVVCKTIYWQEGHWVHTNYYDAEPACTGWVVLLKQKLLKELETKLGKKLESLLVLERECYAYKTSQYHPYVSEIRSHVF